ncbi:MAG: hypothetical protein AB7O56_11375 [Bauldia sp.]
MKARLEAVADAGVLLAVYSRLSARFAADLSDPRDLAQSRAAALMLVQELVRDRH